MSKKSLILNALVAACGLKDVRGEKQDALVLRLIAATGELSDDEWEKLSTPAQDWFNDAVDAVNAKKAPPDFPDWEEDKAASKEKPSGRRGAKAEPEAEQNDVPAVGDIVIVTTKRGKVTEGELLEVDGELAVVMVDGEEIEYSRDRVESITKKGVVGQAAEDAPDYAPAVDDEVVVVTKRGKTITGIVVEVTDKMVVVDDGKDEQELAFDRIESITLSGGGDEKQDAKPYEPALDDVVTVTNKRGKVFVGKIVELDTEVLILDVDGTDQEIPRDRIESIVPDKKATATPEKSRGTKAGAVEEKSARGRGDAKSAEESGAAKTGKVGTKINDGVSVTSRAKEIILDDPKITVDALLKQLTKEGLQFRDVTITIIHKDLNKIMDLMRDRKMLK